MNLDINKLLEDYLSDEYTIEEINEMLQTANIEVENEHIRITYDNGIVESLKINVKLYLTQL